MLDRRKLLGALPAFGLLPSMKIADESMSAKEIENLENKDEYELVGWILEWANSIYFYEPNREAQVKSIATYSKDSKYYPVYRKISNSHPNVPVLEFSDDAGVVKQRMEELLKYVEWKIISKYIQKRSMMVWINKENALQDLQDLKEKYYGLVELCSFKWNSSRIGIQNVKYQLCKTDDSEIVPRGFYYSYH